jgi:hypothetical protein
MGLATIRIMAKVKVYPSKRWDTTQGKDIPSSKLCTREYYSLPMHREQQPDYSRPREVEESLLDGDGCILISKIP